MRRLTSCLIALGLLTIAPALKVVLHAAVSVVGECTSVGNDQSCTFGSGWTSGNHILAVALMTTQTADQLDLTGISATETAFGQINILASYRCYGFSFAVSGADIGDTAFVGSTVGSNIAYIAAIEVNGGSLTEDGTETVVTADNVTPYPIVYTTSVNGSIIFGLIKSSSVSDYEKDTAMTASIPAAGGDMAGGDGVGTALGGYLVTTTAGATTMQWLSEGGNENSALCAYAAQAAAAAGASRKSLGLLGVGN